MWIAVGSAIRGSAGRGTGTGGSDRTASPTFLTISLDGSSRPAVLDMKLGLGQTYPFTVDWGDGTSTEVTSGLVVSHSYSGPAQQYEITLSGEPVVLYNDTRAALNSWIDTVYRFDTLAFGLQTFHEISPAMSGVTTVPARFDSFMEGTFGQGVVAPAPIVLPNNVRNWDVSGVTGWVKTFDNVTAASLGTQPSAWTFASSCSIGLNVFSPMTDADVAACLVAWAANVNQGTGVSVGEAFGSGRSLDETVYASAKAAYDTLIATYSWTFTNTITWTAPLPPLLDTYTNAAAAYSVRLLSSSFSGSALRVRRTVAPFDEQDIGFDSNGDIDTAAIATFGGSDPLTVSLWYDQSGQSNDATQATAGSQPTIYDGSAVITENGKPAVQLDGADDFMTATGGLWSRLAFAGVMYIDVPDDSIVLQYGNTNSRFHVGVGDLGSANKIGSRVYDGAFFGDDGADIADGQYLVYNDASISPDTNEMFLNGSAVTQPYGTRSGNPIVGTYTIGCRGSGSFHFLGKLQELVVWESDQSSNRTAIESNINGYFNVYTVYNPDAPTSGFLFDYSGAAVAYSVRQLNDNATYALRVRRTVAPFDEQDIGFDGSGNLDTSAISTFGGSDSLTVSRWYDQTGNQNHATPRASSIQPTIYDGASVVTFAGQPAIEPIGTNAPEFELTSPTVSSQDWTYHMVVTTTATGTNNAGFWSDGANQSNNKLYHAPLRMGYSQAGTAGSTSYGSFPGNYSGCMVSLRNNTSVEFLRNNTSIGTVVTGAGAHTLTRLLSPAGASIQHRGNEYVVWPSILSSTDTTGIYNDADAYYTLT